MIDFSRLTPADLRSIGIRFETPEETEAFIDLMIEEAEIRVGDAISEGRTEDELDQFEQCITDDETEAWLNEYCPHFMTIIEDVNRQMEKELIQNRDRIPGAVITVPEDITAEEQIPEGYVSLSIDETEIQLEHIRNEKKAIREMYQQGLLSEKERETRMQDCFRRGFPDFLEENGLQISIEPKQWAWARNAFWEYKTNHRTEDLLLCPWLIYNRRNMGKGAASGDEAAAPEKLSVLKLMDEFHVPIDYFQPPRKGMPVPDASPSANQPDYYFIGWKIWKDDGGLLRDNFQPGSTIELTDHYGLKARIQVNSATDRNSKALLLGMSDYQGIGTIEGYTSSRPREIEIYVRNKTIDCLYCKREADDFGYPLWDEYETYERKKQELYYRMIEENIRETGQE